MYCNDFILNSASNAIYYYKVSEPLLLITLTFVNRFIKSAHRVYDNNNGVAIYSITSMRTFHSNLISHGFTIPNTKCSCFKIFSTNKCYPVKMCVYILC